MRPCRGTKADEGRPGKLPTALQEPAGDKIQAQWRHWISREENNRAPLFEAAAPGPFARRVRDYALREFFEARKAAWSNLQAGNIAHFSMSFRSRKDPRESINLTDREFTAGGVFLKRVFAKFAASAEDTTPLKADQDLSTLGKPPADVKLVRKHDRFFLHWPTIVTRKPQLAPDSVTSVAAVDPGIRNPVTIYTTTGTHTTLADSSGRRSLVSRLHALDRLFSKRQLIKNQYSQAPATAAEKKARWRALKKADTRINQRRTKIQSMKKDMHCRIAAELASYDVVVYPKFSAKEICALPTMFHSPTCRKLYEWAHYALRMRVKEKVNMAGGLFVEGSEAYTTRTCSSCGYSNSQIGRAAAWTCRGCYRYWDRDLNGAKGIFLRLIVD